MVRDSPSAEDRDCLSALDAEVVQKGAIGRPLPGAYHRAGQAVDLSAEAATAGRPCRLGRTVPQAVMADRVEQPVPVLAP